MFTTPGLTVVVTMLGAAVVGLVDDWIKVRQQRNLGLNKRTKIFGQLVIGVGFAAGKRAPLPQRISFWCFDFRDVGAEVDEQLAAVRTRDLVGDLDHPKPMERGCHAGSPMAFGSTRTTGQRTHGSRSGRTTAM